ncbi:O-antigen ligase family protein [Phocaeicola vulgatus]|uniref:O-antigen ligase family protein n=1 Tax=Phocaeicola vulgatus TaxID=821 RepID=UPI001E4FCA0F|nr:O-antigen ligase family protein [Phocaeicola vulgatus]
MVFPKVDIPALKYFTIFIALGELLHIMINTAPPLSLRAVYIGIYLYFCFTQIRLIPLFTAMNLIMERFSTVFGEFLPNTMIFHLIILLFGYVQMKNLRGIEMGYFNKRDFSLFILFAVYVFISATYYGDYNFFLRFLFSWLFFHYLLLSSDEYIIALANSIIFVMLLACLFSFYNYNNIISAYATSLGSADRLAWKDSNYLSFFIGISFILLYFKFVYSKDESEKKKYIIALFIFFVSLMMLISRGAILSLLMVLFLYNWKNFFSTKIIKYFLLILGVFLISYEFGLLDGAIMRFMSDDMTTGSGRTKLWATGLNTFFQKDYFTILFGTGEGNAANMIYLNGIYYSPHNNYLELLFNYGVIGLSLFLLSWFLLFVSSKTKEKRALILFFLINSMTIVPLTYVVPLWIIIPLLFMWDERINYLLYE